ncbi:hypothetical protein N6G02_13610 [Cupriavidus gilardii]|uniref:Uncharacterized protein n=2 Tax=Cupriavidus gilardii TaxID=82541 RepID=A0A849BAR3_9BURK|nr:hypothetical protein [Cupriavidus gilardii]ALD91952.1 hypothetical protein CR3_2761 [Cupriavidus gilardii CR3]QQE06802.1 hypothetical protein IC580_14145 [Cupriavidus sp. ISTL7]KAB0596117.1 hypothetical protein F7Q96_14880 [Cupriavidus gilardii]MCT9014033.1 hypothetical protein [Cupriavidus gilardii]MCT9052221.1 hypothetical protein [Cupriavidus gilardii]
MPMFARRFVSFAQARRLARLAGVRVARQIANAARMRAPLMRAPRMAAGLAAVPSRRITRRISAPLDPARFPA